MRQSALILFAHGARDPRWAHPFERLREMTQHNAGGAIVRLAFLEFMTPSLPELVAQLVADGVSTISIVPVFLGQGGHVLRDLPLMLERLRTDFPAIQIQQVQAVGEDESVLNAISNYCLQQLQNR
ncbi:sirohydrochlorin chelatase [Undibacterium oligocarboniphilum]|uniref:CbiX/SirB N-terminal domain-containing protein n=1 Tax=Undibacterium oligocarboniphilum TaxID=666702 RepID=A0A850QC87_9BURK|nr:CbiX/SirB N-terminal domain-containing protein [Undibacterium oligocarboniphilum]MBC3868978.1 CbiX/SirB N-terminal domain-containing protein [Undibacterium oligocarboniphilum]NVO76958.1 CbiX/SirB N-terminal domain-containing protein [Undibacterium oligocarboniphilum]